MISLLSAEMGDHLVTTDIVNYLRPVCQTKQSLINSKYLLNTSSILVKVTWQIMMHMNLHSTNLIKYSQLVYVLYIFTGTNYKN